jgi:hypothetical protein
MLTGVILKRYLRSTCGAATFLAQNLLIVACLLCASSYELNDLCGIFLRPYSRAPSRRYSFGLTATPHHGNIPSALQPRPIHGNIFFGLAAMPHGNNRFFILCLMARINFILPDGDSRLMAISIFFRLTAIINFSLPPGKNRFHSA